MIDTDRAGQPRVLAYRDEVENATFEYIDTSYNMFRLRFDLDSSEGFAPCLTVSA